MIASRDTRAASGSSRILTGSTDYKRFQDTLALFKKYATQYKFDALMLSAQGYQESQLNQEARSPVGAIGLMQVMPATGKDLNVGDITVADSNVHAGTKYMNQLVSRELAGAHLDEVYRTLFAFAAYNCGPGNMAKLRKAAEARGLDPNVWFNNVEIVTAEKIGIEMTMYVRNIYKYYDVIDILNAYVDAQHEYATKDCGRSGKVEFAQRIVSAEGKRDGLFWEAQEGEQESPLGPLVAQAAREGYANPNLQPFHGYYFKILKAQGKHADGGAYSYVVKGKMILGFAIIAYPAEYGNSGVMTFMVNQEGTIYQKNLGRDTKRRAEAMKIFEPDKTWAKTSTAGKQQ